MLFWARFGQQGNLKRYLSSRGDVPDDKTPASRARCGPVGGDQDGRDHEHERIDQIAPNEGPPSADLVDEQDARGLGEEGENVVYGLVFERVLPADAHLAIDRNAVILNSLGEFRVTLAHAHIERSYGDTSHLASSLDRASYQKSSERGAAVRLEFSLVSNDAGRAKTLTET